MTIIHGGDIYRNQGKEDFSVNINPLGIPESVLSAMQGAVAQSGHYPDILSEELKQEVSRMLRIAPEYLLFGNGASELFMAVIHGINPRQTVIPVPSFYGYEYAAGAGEGQIIFYNTRKEDDFHLREDLFSVLNKEVDLLILANPNNPTGVTISREELLRLLDHCRKQQIYVVLDECFIEFCDNACSMLPEIEHFDNLLLVRAFTKIFAIPGVRLGYLIGSNRILLEKIERQLPEWNLSVFAQAAGCACAREMDFVKKTVVYVEKERRFLTSALKQMGCRVFPGEANFLLVYCEQPLYERLLEKNILIRDCSNFRGLSEGFYRIAVKSRKENERLIKAMGEIRWR